MLSKLGRARQSRKRQPRDTPASEAASSSSSKKCEPTGRCPLREPTPPLGWWCPPPWWGPNLVAHSRTTANLLPLNVATSHHLSHKSRSYNMVDAIGLEPTTP